MSEAETATFDSADQYYENFPLPDDEEYQIVNPLTGEMNDWVLNLMMMCDPEQFPGVVVITAPPPDCSGFSAPVIPPGFSMDDINEIGFTCTGAPEEEYLDCTSCGFTIPLDMMPQNGTYECNEYDESQSPPMECSFVPAPPEIQFATDTVCAQPALAGSQAYSDCMEVNWTLTSTPSWYEEWPSDFLLTCWCSPFTWDGVIWSPWPCQQAYGPGGYGYPSTFIVPSWSTGEGDYAPGAVINCAELHSAEANEIHAYWQAGQNEMDQLSQSCSAMMEDENREYIQFNESSGCTCETAEGTWQAPTVANFDQDYTYTEVIGGEDNCTPPPLPDNFKFGGDCPGPGACLNPYLCYLYNNKMDEIGGAFEE
jgi:hypothetical protein